MQNLRNTQFLLVLVGILLSLLTTPLSAQNGVERIVIVNGGKFNDPTENVNIMLYNPVTGQTDVIDTIHTASVQEVLLEGSTAYVAAQDSIVKYDLSTGERLAVTAFGAPSTVKMGIYNNYLLVGNWYGLTSGNLRIFNKNDLAFVDSIPQLSKGAKDFVIVGDTAYVAQNFTNQFFGDSAGYISVVDLNRMRFVRDITLDPSDELGRLAHVNGRLYGVNPNVETITIYDIASCQTLPKRFTGLDMQFSSRAATFHIYDDLLYTSINNGVGVYDLANNQIIDTTLIDTLATAFALDTINDIFYLTQTDFFSYMRGGIFDANGSKTGAFLTGFSPEAIGIVYNDLPVANNDGGFTPTNQSILLDVLDNDEDDGSLTVVLGSSPIHGMVSIQGNQLLYEPDAGFTGFDRFTYQAIDGWGNRDTAEVQIQIGSTSSPMGAGGFGLERVIFSTGGTFLGGGNEITAYSYNPENRELKAFDKILGDFSNAVAVESYFAYVHVGRSDFNPFGKDQIIKYRMDDEVAVDTAFDVSGANNILLHDLYMIVTRAFGADSNYVLFYDKTDLAAGPKFVDTTIPVQTSGAVILDDILYVAFNQADTARIAIYELGIVPRLDRIVSLDTTATPLGDLLTDGENIIGLTELTIFPPPTFSPVVLRAGVTVLDPSDDSWQTTATPAASGGIGVFGDSLFANFGNGVGIFNLQNNLLERNPVFQLDYTTAKRDDRTGSFFFLETDYFSYGQLGSSDSIGEFRFNLPTDISGTAMALVYNHAPFANDDYGIISQVPRMIDVLFNDVDEDKDSLRVEIAIPPRTGTASIVGNQVLYTGNNNFGSDEFTYLAIDSWGRADSAVAYFGPGESIDEDLGLGKISLFPNPASENVFLKFEEVPVRGVEISIFDLQGRKVLTSQFQQVQQIQLAIGDLTSGSYQVLVKYEDKVWSTRFLKR